MTNRLHNGPPDPIDEALAPFGDTITEAEGWLDGTAVETEGQMKAVDAQAPDGFSGIVEKIILENFWARSWYAHVIALPGGDEFPLVFDQRIRIIPIIRQRVDGFG